MRVCADWDCLELRRTRRRAIVSATIIPWRQRMSDTVPQASLYLPALLDGQVSVHAVMEGLASVGLTLQHDRVTGKVLIARKETSDQS